MVVCWIGAFSWSYWTLSAVYSVFHLDSPSLQHSLEKSFKAINWGNCRVHLTIFQLSRITVLYSLMSSDLKTVVLYILFFVVSGRMVNLIPVIPCWWGATTERKPQEILNETKAHYFHTHKKIWNSIETHLFEAYIICFNHFQCSSFLPIWSQRLSPPFL